MDEGWCIDSLEKKVPRKGTIYLLREGYDIGPFVIIFCQHVLSLFFSIHKVRRVHLHPFSIWPRPWTAKEVAKAGNECLWCECLSSQICPDNFIN